MSPRGDPFGFEAVTAQRWLGLVRATLWPYFRPQIIGAEHLPVSGRALIVGCHYGVIPYDTACALVAIHEATGRYARSVGDNVFASIGAVERFLHRVGAVVGRPEVVERLLRRGHMVLVIPGGAKDSARLYLTQRYRALPIRGFAPGRGGYIKIALRTRSPIVPFAAVGGEEAHVTLGTLPFVDRLLGVPFFPLVLFPFPLPTKLYIRFGEPIMLAGTPADADDQRTVDELNTAVRRRVQKLIDDTLRRRQGIIFSTYAGGQGPERVLANERAALRNGPKKRAASARRTVAGSRTIQSTVRPKRPNQQERASRAHGPSSPLPRGATGGYSVPSRPPPVPLLGKEGEPGALGHTHGQKVSSSGGVSKAASRRVRRSRRRPQRPTR